MVTTKQKMLENEALRRQVRVLRSSGLTHKQVAATLGIKVGRSAWLATDADPTKLSKADRKIEAGNRLYTLTDHTTKQTVNIRALDIEDAYEIYAERRGDRPRVIKTPDGDEAYVWRSYIDDASISLRPAGV